MEVETSEADRVDRALVRRIAGGDREAFETLYDAHARRIFAYSRTVLGSTDGAEEVASDTLVHVWRSAKSYAGRARVLTWMLAIAHHRAIDVLRRKRLNVVPLEALADVADASGDPLAAALRAGDRDVLDAALMLLSADHRAVLDLAFTHDCSYEDIAKIINVPIGTVKTRVFHAKRNLRAALDRAQAQEAI